MIATDSRGQLVLKHRDTFWYNDYRAAVVPSLLSSICADWHPLALGENMAGITAKKFGPYTAASLSW